MIRQMIWVFLLYITFGSTSLTTAFTTVTTFRSQLHRISHSQIRASDLIASDPALSSEKEEINGTETLPEEDEYEDVELEYLTENEFYNSEWKIGTVWNKNDRSKIEETWVRLISQDDGTNVAVWGDGAKGTWVVDVTSQFFSISKESFGGWGGKKIWAGGIDDYYYLQGSVRGWNPLSPARVLGSWQMKRLGVTSEEAGIAPWFVEDKEDVDQAESQEGEKTD